MVLPTKQSMLPRLRRSVAKYFLDYVVPVLVKTGLTPNQLSFIGLGISAGSGALAGTGNLFWAGVLVLVGGIFDLFDGSVARATNRTSIKGAFLDSNLDRVGEALTLTGILVYGLRQDNDTIVVLTFLSLMGSLMVSYVKARAEGLGLACDVGLFTRTERVIVVAVALLLGRLVLPLYLLAVFSMFTAVQRFWDVWRRKV